MNLDQFLSDGKPSGGNTLDGFLSEPSPGPYGKDGVSMGFKPSARPDTLAPDEDAGRAALGESGLGYMTRAVGKLPTAMATGLAGAVETGASLPGRFFSKPAQQEQELTAQASELGTVHPSQRQPDALPGQVTNVPGLQAPTAPAPAPKFLPLEMEQGLQDEIDKLLRSAGRSREDAATGGMSLLRDAALTGLNVSGAGTPIGMAATVGAPAVMESFGLSEGLQGLGENLTSAIKSGQTPGPVREMVGDIAGEVLTQAPTLGALGFGLAPAVTRLRTQAPVGGSPVEVAPVDVYGKATEKAVRRGLGQEPLPKPEPQAPLAPEKPVYDTSKNLLTLVNKVLPESVKDVFRTRTERIRSASPEAAEAVTRNKELKNLLENDTASLQNRIRENLTPAEGSRVYQLMQGLPVKRLPGLQGKLDPVANHQQYAQRLEAYRQVALNDVVTNSPGLSDAAQKLAAESIAFSRILEEVGMPTRTKDVFNYKMSAAERAPLNAAEQELRGKILSPREEAGLQIQRKADYNELTRNRKLGTKEGLERVPKLEAELATAERAKARTLDAYTEALKAKEAITKGITDETPEQLYHGTPAEGAFTPTTEYSGGLYGGGAYLTTKPGTANLYAKKKGPGGQVKGFTLKPSARVLDFEAAPDLAAWKKAIEEAPEHNVSRAEYRDAFEKANKKSVRTLYGDIVESLREGFDEGEATTYATESMDMVLEKLGVDALRVSRGKDEAYVVVKNPSALEPGFVKRGLGPGGFRERLAADIETTLDDLGSKGALDKPEIVKQKLKQATPRAKADVELLTKNIRAIGQKLADNPKNVDAHAALVDRLTQDYTKGGTGYAKQMFQEKLLEGLEESAVPFKPTSSTRKADQRGFTRRQDEAATSGLTKVFSAPEALNRAMQDNFHAEPTKAYFKALAGTPVVEALDGPNAEALTKKGWKKMPEDEAYGALANKLVHPALYDELQVAVDATTPNALAKGLEELTDFRARNLTVGTISSNVMNTLGGLFAADVSTPVSILEAPSTLYEGLMVSKSPYFTQAKMGSRTSLAQEGKLLAFMEKEFDKKMFKQGEGGKFEKVPEGTPGAFSFKERYDAKAASKRTAMGHVLDGIDSGLELFQAYSKYLGLEPAVAAANPVAMARFHHVMEGIIRDGLYVKMRKQGLGHREASDLVKKSQVDYGDRSKFVDTLRKFAVGGQGQRFAHFGVEQGKNLLEAATNANPFVAARFWKWPLITKMWNDHMQQVNGESDEERSKRLKMRKPFESGTDKNTALGFAGSAFQPDFLSWDMPKNKEGNVQTLNARRMDPYGWMHDIAGGVATAFKSEADRGPGMKQAAAAVLQPQMGLAPIANVLADYDPFYQRSPLPGGTDLSTPEGQRAGAEYLAGAYAPQAFGQFPQGRARVERMEENPLAKGLRGYRVNPQEDLARLVSGLRLQNFNPKMEELSTAKRAGGFMRAAEPGSTMREDVTKRGALELTKENLRKGRELFNRTGGR